MSRAGHHVCRQDDRAIRQTLAITQQRRTVQKAYNDKHGITPRTIKKEITVLVEEEKDVYQYETMEEGRMVAEEPHEYLTLKEVRAKISSYEQLMKEAAKEMQFEDATTYRDLMKKYQKIELTLS